MNISVAKLNETTASDTVDSELIIKTDKTIAILIATVYCSLGFCIIAISSVILYRQTKYEKNERIMWDVINRAIAKIVAGAILLPVCAILVMNESHGFLTRSACFVLLGLQLFSFIGHHLCGYLTLVLLRISVLNPLRSQMIVSSKCIVVSLCVIWGVTITSVAASTLAFMLREPSHTRSTPVQRCSWIVMYPRNYLYTVVYIIFITGHILGSTTVFEVSKVVRHHRTQIGAQRRMADSTATVGTTAKSKSRRVCAVRPTVVPCFLLMVTATVMFFLQLHCDACIPEPWSTFSVWGLFGLAILSTAVVLYFKKVDHA